MSIDLEAIESELSVAYTADDYRLMTLADIARIRLLAKQLLAEVKRLNERIGLLSAIIDAYIEICDKNRSTISKLMEAHQSVTAERDALIEDFTDFACGGCANAAPYCANKSPECTDAHEWCIDEKCKGFRPSACGAGKEQNDG